MTQWQYRDPATANESARMIANALDGVRGKNFIGVASAATSTGAHA